MHAGQQHQSSSASVHPKVADRPSTAARHSPYNRNRQRDTHRGGSEVVVRQPGHLRQLAHRRFRVYGCQFVLVVKKLPYSRLGQAHIRQPLRLNTSQCCVRSIKYSTSIETALKSTWRCRTCPSHFAFFATPVTR